MSRLPNRCRRLLTMTAMAIAACGFSDEQLDAHHSSAPKQVESTCRSKIAPTDSLKVIAPVAIPEKGLILSKSEISLQLAAPQDRATARRLAGIARDQAESVLLQLKCVEADRPPGATWEVYVGLPADLQPNAEGPYFVGNVALFGDGIKSEPNGTPFAEFVFPLDRAIKASSGVSALTLTFVPSSGVIVGGRATSVEVKAPVRVGEVNLLLDKAQPTGQR